MKYDDAYELCLSIGNVLDKIDSSSELNSDLIEASKGLIKTILKSSPETRFVMCESNSKLLNELNLDYGEQPKDL